jgi:ribulose-phosphate 3-epimerase
MSCLLAPSILSADFARLGEAVEMLHKSEADWIHVDVMDGVFVPNISFGFPVIKSVRKFTDKPFDVHLMIVQPERYVKEFKAAGADILTVQYEACTHLHRVIYQIKEEGMKAGVALNPHTPVSALHDVIADLDLVLIMSVNPGFGGQKFIHQAFNKLREVKEMIRRSGSSALVEIDGGASLDNAAKLMEAGADVLVAGNAVFGTKDPLETIKAFKAIKPGAVTI